MQITAFCNKHLNLRHLLCLPVCCALCPHDIFGSISVNFNFYSDCTSILPHSALFPKRPQRMRLCGGGAYVCVCMYLCAFVLRIAKVLRRTLATKCTLCIDASPTVAIKFSFYIAWLKFVKVSFAFV